MTLEQIFLFPLSGRFYNFSEIETIIAGAKTRGVQIALDMKPALVPVMANVGRKYRRNNFTVSN